jgi:hypothetical protein
MGNGLIETIINIHSRSVLPLWTPSMMMMMMMMWWWWWEWTKHYTKLLAIKETIGKEAREGAVEERRGRCYCV